MGLIEIITLILVVCKIFGIGIVATWPWWKILLPQMCAVGIYVFIVFCCIILAASKR